MCIICNASYYPCAFRNCCANDYSNTVSLLKYPKHFGLLLPLTSILHRVASTRRWSQHRDTSSRYYPCPRLMRFASNKNIMKATSLLYVILALVWSVHVQQAWGCDGRARTTMLHNRRNTAALGSTLHRTAPTFIISLREPGHLNIH